jgi:hypothetical protein
MGRFFISCLLVIGAALTAAAVLASCTEPCDDLAGRICGCEPTKDTESLCKRTYVAGNPVNITSKQQDQCDQLLSTCTCAALAGGDYAACGLAYTRDF